MSESDIYGMPLDRVLHFLVAGMIFLVASRWLQKRWAITLAVLAIILKELIDIPMKAEIAERGVNLTVDAIWDIVFGIAGIGAAWLFVAWRGEGWKVQRLGASLKPPDNCWYLEVNPRSLQIGLSAALFIVVFAGLSLMIIPGINWPHPIAVVLVILSFWRFGGFHTMVGMLLLIPFVNWFDYYVVAKHPISASEVSLLALAACCMVSLIRRPPKCAQLTALDLSVAGFSTFSTIAAAVALMRPSASIQGAAWLLRPIEAAIVYFVITRFATNKRHITELCKSIVWGLTIICVVGIIEFIIKPLHLSIVPGSAFGDAAAFGTYLPMAVPFVFALFLYTRGTLRWASLAASILGAICVGLVYSRTCWTSISITTGVLFVAWGFRKDFVLGIAVCFVSLILGFVGFQAVRNVAGSPSSPHFIREFSTILKPGSLRRSRWRMIETSANRIKANPLFGQPGLWVENYYLTLGANHGLLSLGAAGLAFAIIVLRGMIRLWRVHDGEAFGVAIGGWLGIVGALVAGFALGSFARPTFIPLLWSLVAIVALCLNLAGTVFETLPQAKLSPLDSKDISGKIIHQPDVAKSRRPIAFLVIVLFCLLSIVAMLALILRG